MKIWPYITITLINEKNHHISMVNDLEVRIYLKKNKNHHHVHFWVNSPSNSDILSDLDVNVPIKTGYILIWEHVLHIAVSLMLVYCEPTGCVWYHLFKIILSTYVFWLHHCALPSANGDLQTHVPTSHSNSVTPVKKTSICSFGWCGSHQAS